MHIREGDERLAGHEHVDEFVHQFELSLQLPPEEQFQGHGQHEGAELLEVDVPQESLLEVLQPHEVVHCDEQLEVVDGVG